MYFLKSESEYRNIHVLFLFFYFYENLLITYITEYILRKLNHSPLYIFFYLWENIELRYH